MSPPRVCVPLAIPILVGQLFYHCTVKHFFKLLFMCRKKGGKCWDFLLPPSIYVGFYSGNICRGRKKGTDLISICGRRKRVEKFNFGRVFVRAAQKNPDPTTNSVMQNGSSVGYMLHTRFSHFWCRLACLSTKFLHRSSVESLLTVRFVGWGGSRIEGEERNSAYYTGCAPPPPNDIYWFRFAKKCIS